MNEIAERTQAPAPSTVEDLIARGDLSKLTPSQRVVHYHNVCRTLGLNPLTQPFQYVTLNGKLQLYAKKDATDQLRKINGISVGIISRTVQDGVFTAHARATDKTGRQDEDFGAVSVMGLRGEALANATMKAVTKAKRRVTLSISGLGFVDESEIDPSFATVEEQQPSIGDRAREFLSSQPHEQASTGSREGAADTGPATTKEMKPCPVPRDKDAEASVSWSTWATLFIKYVRAASSEEVINDWINENAEHLAALAHYDQGKHERLVAMVKREIELRNESHGDDTR